MTICKLCSNEMTTGASCSVHTLHINGRAYPLAPHSGPGSIPGRKRPCGDCGVAPDGYHHPGCDLQRCPRCFDQLFLCDCRWDELEGHDARGCYDDDDADDWEDDPDDLVDDGWLDDVDDVDEDDEDAGDRGAGSGRSGIEAAMAARDERFRSVPFAAAAAPARAEHHGAVVELAAWAMAAGRPVDRDVAAVLIGLMTFSSAASDDGSSGSGTGRLLRRPDVNNVLRTRLVNWCSLRQTLTPERVPEHLWTLLTWAASTGRIHPDSDPLHALLEPLRCYGGLDANGWPLPQGAPREIDCQCMLPFDPTLPEGMINRIMAWEEAGPIIERVEAPARDGALTDHGAFLRLAARVNTSRLQVRLFAEEWSFVGRRPAEGATPALWFYNHDPSSRRGFPALALDEHGTVHVPVRDRRRKAGHRWSAVGDPYVYRAIPADASRPATRARRSVAGSVPAPRNAPAGRSRGRAFRSGPRDRPPRRAG